jgi:hypothetical protein
VADYRGFNVLEVDPDRGEPTPDEVQRRVFTMDSITGARTAIAADPAAAGLHGFRWLTFGRAEAKALRDFIDARRGRAVPCWFPSWEEDLTLATDHAIDATTLVILSMGYADNMFPATNVRRHIAIRVLGIWYYRKVTAAIDNLNGTETLTLEEKVPVAMPQATTMICFLRFARLDEDMIEIEWTGQFAEAQLRLRDLPTETPA